jgi:hypothetical protein
MLFAVLIMLMGLSFTPAIGHVGVSPVVAEVLHPEVVAEHMRLRKACGLPVIHNFGCRDGVFTGRSPVIKKLSCSFNLTAVIDNTTHHFDLIDLGGPTVKRAFGLKDDLHKFSSTWVTRWAKNESYIADSFNTEKGDVTVKLTDSYIESYNCTKFCYQFRQLALKWVRKESGLGYMMLVPFNIQHKEIGLGMITGYSPRLQYQCIGNEPKLHLLPPHRG